ncbi:hypothetical protein BDP81DRAFT_89459 [Colletotrichum phormii]|uniref:Uncharacterized protein n=1 Tax=Colletotrichum phormii TaxID=359342 RepID=A0AAJ0A4F5_9PEZI|nr:uncharacterized protein BDP81DRAFT_89459 [Colletotrichum phormii]KAK1654832.1 hypothetical protein BDP81DRAFT_89459 [Colletotrichum phormii]
MCTFSLLIFFSHCPSFFLHPNTCASTTALQPTTFLYLSCFRLPVLHLDSLALCSHLGTLPSFSTSLSVSSLSSRLPPPPHPAGLGLPPFVLRTLRYTNRYLQPRLASPCAAGLGTPTPAGPACQPTDNYLPTTSSSDQGPLPPNPVVLSLALQCA